MASASRSDTRRAPSTTPATEPKSDNAALWSRPEFRDLPLTLSALIASGYARLGTLRRMAAGEVIPMETHVGEPSLLIADGKPVGAGEVVEVSGKLCLRLTRVGRVRD